MITEEILKNAGYKKYPSNELFTRFADFFYQKKVTDKTGTAYFIRFLHYAELKFANDAISPESFMFEVVINEPHSTFQIHRATDLPDCEQKADEFWRMMGSVYYETKTRANRPA